MPHADAGEDAGEGAGEDIPAGPAETPAEPGGVSPDVIHLGDGDVCLTVRYPDFPRWEKCCRIKYSTLL